MPSQSLKMSDLQPRTLSWRPKPVSCQRLLQVSGNILNDLPEGSENAELCSKAALLLGSSILVLLQWFLLSGGADVRPG